MSTKLTSLADEYRGHANLTGCFSDQHAEVLTEYHQIVDELFEWMVKKFRPRVERICKLEQSV